MKKNNEFNFDRFMKALNQEEELTEVQAEGHRIISTISDYDDCTTEFIMSLTEEGLAEAIRIVEIETPRLAAMISAEKCNSLIKDIEVSRRKPNKRDLF